MLEFSHFVLMAAVSRSWGVHKASTLARWKASVAGTPLEPMIDELHTLFTTDGKDVSFIDHWNAMHWQKNEHIMCFSFEGMGDTAEFLGHNEVRSFQADGDSFASKATAKVGVYCMSPHPFVTPMLARFARHTILQERDWLVSSGLDLHTHAATTSMHMPMELVAEGIPMVYACRADFLFTEVETVGRVGGSAGGTRKPVSVTDIDDMVAKLVNRETRAATQLGGTFQGAVRRTPR